MLRRLKSLNVCRTTLRMYYDSVEASALLIKLIHKASDTVGIKLDSLMVVSERRMLSKFRGILDTAAHLINDV